ncbi:STAS-like domain-containing protein [Megamonas hypermegale]|uniref:STAS-like domain-containing protein n=1 Tax=Megamonas hypermegale TaxID=158847 RepID=UPI00242E9816|nr:STAS-like domain-containing protein [Megamonas hypermegale]
MYITIREFVKSNTAVSYDDGQKCLKVILAHIDDEREIFLDFKGIDFVITAFLNPIIGNLILQKEKTIMKKIKICNTNENIIGKIELVRDGALLKREDML